MSCTDDSCDPASGCQYEPTPTCDGCDASECGVCGAQGEAANAACEAGNGCAAGCVEPQ